MFDLFEQIEQKIHEMLESFILSNLTGMFTDVNEKTGTIATEVGQTPQGWNGGIFSMIQNLGTMKGFCYHIVHTFITAPEQDMGDWPACIVGNANNIFETFIQVFSALFVLLRGKRFHFVNTIKSKSEDFLIIISSTKHPEEAWQFLQWWASDAVQIEYGREVEATFGVASRWNPANKNAVASLPYTQDELNVIFDQWDWLKESPNTLGGYYTNRYLITALNQTVLQGKNARVALEDAIKEINKEMRRKQAEYKIPEGGSVLQANS